jgi:YHS domain-containing protein
MSAPLVGEALAQAPAGEERRTLRVDAVDLARGVDSVGDASHRAEHAGFIYLFASEENQRAFLRDPEHYEIQLGGACARMGPLSGMGTTANWATHEGKLYIFASESCRETFLANADRLLEHDDPMLDRELLTPEAMAKGREWIDRAIESIGGAERLDALRSLRTRRTERPVHNGVEYLHVTSRYERFPDDFAEVDAWDEDWWSHAVSGENAFFSGSDGRIRDMHPQQRRAVERDRARSLHAALRARTRGDFFACELPPEAGDDAQAVVRVATWFDGTRVDLVLDRASGRPVGMAYAGRGPSLMIGRVERRFTGFAEAGGLTLPNAWSTTFDGAPAESLGAKDLAIAADPEDADTPFKRP